jgi:hypothetical protein
MDHDKAARRALLVAKALKHHVSVIHNPASIMGNPPPPVARYGMMAPHLAQIAPVARAEGGEVEEHPDNWEDAYHATHMDVNQFDLSKAGSATTPGGGRTEKAVFLTSHPENAKTYLGGQFVNRANAPHTEDIGNGVGRHYEPGANIMPLRVNTSGFHEWDYGGGLYNEDHMREMIRQAKKEKAPGVKITNIKDQGYFGLGSGRPTTTYAVLDTSRLRSKFAKFDPQKAKKKDLMAANGGAIEGSDPAFTDADETAQMKYIQDPNLAMPANQVDQDIEGGAYADGGEVEQQTQVSPEQRAENLSRFMSVHPDIPKTMYHGKAGEYSDTYMPERFFLTPDPKFAEDFAHDAASRSVDEHPNIMPFHVGVKNPFDYDNPEHVNFVKNNARLTSMGPEQKKDFFEDLAKGEWHAIEHPDVQKLIKNNFDSFFVREMNDNGDYLKNLGVYGTKKIKSATGNNGNFDPAKHDIRRADGGEVPSHPALGIPGVHIRTAEVGEPIFHGEK